MKSTTVQWIAVVTLISSPALTSLAFTPVVQAQNTATTTFQSGSPILPEVLANAAAERFGSEDVGQKMEVACMNMLKAFNAEEQTYKLQPNDMADALTWSLLKSYLVYTGKDSTSDAQDAAMRTRMRAFVLGNAGLQQASDREKQMLYEDAAIAAMYVSINSSLAKQQGSRPMLSEAQEMAAVNFTSLTGGMLPPAQLSAADINELAYAISKTAERSGNKSLFNAERIQQRQYEVKRYYQGLDVQPFVFLHPTNQQENVKQRRLDEQHYEDRRYQRQRDQQRYDQRRYDDQRYQRQQDQQRYDQRRYDNRR